LNEVSNLLLFDLHRFSIAQFLLRIAAISSHSLRFKLYLLVEAEGFCTAAIKGRVYGLLEKYHRVLLYTSATQQPLNSSTVAGYPIKKN
jgi:hypothetical protein